MPNERGVYGVVAPAQAAAGHRVAPVALAVDEQIFLTYLYHGVTNGSIAVGMVLHGVADNVGRLVKAPIIHFLQRVQYPALNRF